MRKTAIHSLARSGDEVTLLLAEARNNERLRCAGAVSARLATLASFIASQRLDWSDAAELLRQEATHIDNQALELH
ncbi:DUF2732 family protein [Kosakonia cowanii]|uniref:DUF2732 family protein n=1 Tax=Kosakonia cowanii TaxID=208223 RepID=UPI003F6957B0